MDGENFAFDLYAKRIRITNAEMIASASEVLQDSQGSLYYSRI
jgi:hypothetical protein